MRSLTPIPHKVFEKKVWRFLFVGWLVDLVMRKYLSIILFISVGLGQDVLTTKKGIEYKGKMIEAGYDEVKFIREELPNPQNVKTEIIQSLILSDGTEIVKNGILIRDSFVKEESSNSLNQAVIREKAISDKKINDALNVLFPWGCSVVGCLGLAVVFGSLNWELLPFILGGF